MHIGFIMDGNRRWAKQRSLPTKLGHKAGGDTLSKVIEICFKHNIKTITVYALSTENFQKRSKEEINYLIKLAHEFAANKKEMFVKHDIKIVFLGDLTALPKESQNMLFELQEETKNCQKGLLQIAINYGGRQEIIQAVKQMTLNEEEISIESLEKNLYSSLEPELIVRTGGRYRTSNFLLWQACYSEYYFSDKLWPDFDEAELQQALNFYQAQTRNFGQ